MDELESLNIIAEELEEHANNLAAMARDILSIIEEMRNK